MRIGEAAAAEIRHRVGFAPDDVVEDPEAEVLKDRADAEDIVVGADHPQRRARLHHPAAGGEPGAGEIVIGGEAGEFVPVVVDGIDAEIVGTLEIALELQIVRRIGEYQIDRLRPEVSPSRQRNRRRGCARTRRTRKLTRGALADAPRRDTTITQNSDSGDAVGDAGPTTDERIMPRQGKNRLNRKTFRTRQ